MKARLAEAKAICFTISNSKRAPYTDPYIPKHILYTYNYAKVKKKLSKAAIKS